MNVHQFIEPSYLSLSGFFLNKLNQSKACNPRADANLSERITAFVMRRLAAFPLIACAIVDLILSPLTACIIKGNAKYHMISLISTISLFPQALGVLFLGKMPQINCIKSLFNNPHPHIPSFLAEKKELILTQLKRVDLASLNNLLNPPNRETILRTIIDGGMENYWSTYPELLDFIIENTRPEMPLGSEDPFFVFGAFTDLEAAVKLNHSHIVEKILKLDERILPSLTPEKKSLRNDKLLAIAIAYQRPDLITFFINIGANPLTPINGKTPWALALEVGNTENIALLIKAGIDPNVPITEKFTALDFGLFGFSSENTVINHMHGPIKNSHYSLDHTIRFSGKQEAAKRNRLMLVQAGAIFDEHFFDQNFRTAVKFMETCEISALEQMKAENQALGDLGNPYLAKILEFALDPYSRIADNTRLTDYAKFLNRLIMDLPRLIEIKTKLINDKAHDIHESIGQPQINAGFTLDLARITAEY